MEYQDITTDAQLRQYCRGLADVKTIAFDTEFVSEHTYRPVLCLIQVAADDQLAVIDALTVSDTTPFWEAVAAPGHETVVHAGRSEVEFCWQAIGRFPAGLVDVQVAAGLAGAEYPAGLGALVHKFLGRTPAKHETRTDWRRRPLSKRQLEYAVSDASCLPPLCEAIRGHLERLGRLGWLAEEMQSWQRTVERSLSKERWRRVSGNSALTGRGLAIVRELFHWRDREAERRDQPVRRILRDDLIVELARCGSADPKRIQAVRGMERGDLRRHLDEIAAAVARGVEVPEADCPARPHREHVPELSVLGQFLFAALGSVCREVELAPNLVATPNDIREWTSYRMGRGRPWEGEPPQLARGWRAEVIGRLFDDLLSGKLVVRIENPKSGHPLAFEPAQ
ncbi:MAG: HRDC domain-containing protein [Planctomycetaceae bacterium]|nr:HRDC domain-containing protein [Planctomycetaceae bacterium]